MKTIVVSGAGGAAATNFIRSIRMSPDAYNIVGVDSDKYGLQKCEADIMHLVPRADAEHYIDALNDICDSYGAWFLHSQNDAELLKISECREDLQAQVFLPSKETVQVCQDKYISSQIWKNAGMKVPETIFVGDYSNLETAFDAFGEIWLREVRGAFGKGSLPTRDIKQARAWLDFHKGWGRFTAAERLEPGSVTWQTIWQDGELLVAQGRKRLYWEFANRAPSGITGLTGTGITVSDPVVDAVGEAAIMAVDPKPHGIFCVDMTYDRMGVPNPTEINIGRFFTTNLFFTAAGLNMPHIYLKYGLGEKAELPEKRINPLPAGLAWVRGMDVEPILTTVAEIEASNTEMEQRLQRLRLQQPA